MKTIYLTFLCLLLNLIVSEHAVGQTGSLTGSINDPQNIALEGATAVLINQSDSLMIGFALTDAKGRYLIDEIKLGEYILQISFLGYKDIEQPIEITSKERLQIEELTMEESGINLDEILVEGEHVPIRMKKDTIEYNANAFKVSPNADVEALLKKLPGVEVAKDGSIKANGETVTKVLVEGKEFFGDDPTIATKNLPADAVDKVQVFDKKSEMEEFSGIDDGNKSTTINLALKDDKKKGFFGNGKIGYGTEDTWEGKFNINSFHKKAQLSAIGAANNINEQAFSFSDYMDLMGGFGAAFSSGEVTISGDDFDFDSGQGFTDAYSLGLNYNRDFGKKTELTSNYFFSRTDKDLDRNSFTQNILNEGTFSTSENSFTNNINNRHKLNLNIKSKIDSSQLFSIKSTFALNTAETNRAFDRTLLGFSETPENNTTTTNSTDRDKFSFGIQGSYNKRFGKASRVLSIRGNVASEQTQNNGLLNSLNTFFADQRIETIDQRQNETNDQLNYEIGMSYTEPLGKRQYLDVAYSRQNYDNDFEKNFFDILNDPIQSETLNHSLSDAYNRSFIYDRVGLTYKLNRKKYKLSLGTQYQISKLDGAISSTDINIEKQFENIMPRMNFSYDFNNSTRMSMNYNTSIREPNLQQLQPIASNSDPLYIYIGNPNLDAAYSHRLGMNFSSFSSFSNIGIFATGTFTYTKNRITNSQSIDENFVQTITPINVKDDYQYTTYSSFNAPIKFAGMKVGITQDMNISNSILFLNGESDNVNRSRHGVSINLESRKKAKLDWLIGTRVGYNKAAYKKNNNLNQDYFDQNYYTDISSDFAKGWHFETSFDYKIYSAEAFGERTTIPLWRASISKNFLKNQKGQLTFSAVDILNQNLGINRSNSLNYILDERVVSLGRYFMLTMGYKFSGFGNKEVKAISIGSSRRR